MNFSKKTTSREILELKESVKKWKEKATKNEDELKTLRAILDKERFNISDLNEHIKELTGRLSVGEKIGKN